MKTRLLEQLLDQAVTRLDELYSAQRDLEKSLQDGKENLLAYVRDGEEGSHASSLYDAKKAYLTGRVANITEALAKKTNDILAHQGYIINLSTQLLRMEPGLGKSLWGSSQLGMYGSNNPSGAFATKETSLEDLSSGNNCPRSP